MMRRHHRHRHRHRHETSRLPRIDVMIPMASFNNPTQILTVWRTKRIRKPAPPVYSRHYVWDYPVPAGRPLAALPRGPWLFQGENEAWHTPAILGTIPQQQSAPTARLNQSVLLAQSSQSARPAQRNPSTRSQPIRSQPARTLTRAPTKNRLTRPTTQIHRIQSSPHHPAHIPTPAT